MRTRIVVILAIAMALIAAACGSDESTDTTSATTTTSAATTTAADACAVDNLNLVTPGTLTIATGEPVYPPWMIDDDPTNKQGFEGAVAYAIAEQMGFADSQVTWVRTGFDEAIAPGPKDFDFNLQQFTITEVRKEVVDFSAPYYVTSQALVAFPDSAIAGATTIADLKDAKLGAQIGTTSLDFIDDVIQPTTAAAVYDTNSDAKSALTAKQIDGIVVDLPTAFFITAAEIEGSVIVGQFDVPAAQPDAYGLLFAKGNSLVACVDQAIAALRADGTLDALTEEWLAQATDVKTISS